ncbi:MAG: hypothetical protein EA408_04565 [Marinilabiliales bacterium]|nr:MAG: hypothetical protein EA408_04565 [Marinilabiliales bacterium]
MHKRIIIALVLVLPLINLSAQQRVTPPPSPDAPRELEFTHAGNRGGFFIGAGSMSGDIGGIFELSGGVIEGGFGYFLGITDNLAANFSFDIQYAPEIVISGAGLPMNSAGNLAALNTQLGVAYFFMPGEFFVSACLLLSMADLSETAAEFTTGFGPGLSLAAGKEFRLSNRILVGVGYRFRYASMAIEDYYQFDMEGERLGLMSHGIYMSLTWFSRR